MNATRALLILVLLLVQLVNLAPSGQAANTDWTSEYANSLTDSVREIALAHDGERLGMAYRLANSDAIGFSIRATDGSWTQKNAAAVPSARQLTSIHLLNTGAASWLLVGPPAGFGQLNTYTSTDDGSTWTEHAAITGATTIQSFDVATISSSKIGFAWCDGSVLHYAGSTDKGASFAYGFLLNDNAGNPLQSSGTQMRCFGTNVAITGGGNGQAYVEFDGATPPCPNNAACTFWVQSTGGNDQFWTVPFYNGGSCPTGCSPVDGSGAGLLYMQSHNTIGSYGLAFPQNGDLLTLVRNGAGSCVGTSPNTLAFSAAYLGQDNSDSNGACSTYQLGAYQKVSPATGCAAFETTGYDRITGNSAHTIMAAFGHTALCAGVGFEIDLKSDTGAWAQTYTNPAQTKVFDVDMTASKAWAAFVDTTAGGQVKVISASAPTTATPTSAKAAVSGLVGFDVDPFDQSVVARTSNATGGQDIRVYDPMNLHQAGVIHEANCNRLGGVATRFTAGKSFVSFIDCDSNNNVNAFRIRDQNLNPPDQSGTICQGSDFCDWDITGPFGAAGATAPPSNARDLGRMEAAPWDYTLGSDESGCPTCVKHVTLSWAYSEINGGHLGLYAITQNNNAQDQAATASQVYAPQGSVIDDFCAWRDTATGKDYVAAARQDGPTRVYSGTVREASGGAYHYPVVTLGSVFLGNGGYDNAVSLGCARDRILVLTADGRAVVAQLGGGATNGRVLATFPAANPVKQSVALSLDGARGVYGADGVYHYLDMVNLTEITTTAIPASTLYATSFDFNAKVMWIATPTAIYRSNTAALLFTANVPTGANRDLTTGRITTCTDEQGATSSNCTGIADPPPTPTSSSSSSSSATSSASTSTSGSGTDSSTDTSTDGNSTGNQTTNTTGDGGGGGGFVAEASGAAPAFWMVAIVAVVVVIGLAATRRKGTR